ncbi:MAG: FtsX-like permease family protein [Acidobacteria bacterium]|nr:FtsX-like permease family protein [Acidobacteriota bacterium]
MSKLALRNLFHDKVRLAVTLTGVVFALILMVIQFGLFLGFLETSGNVVEHSGIDLWITAPGIPHVNGGSPIPERRRYKAMAAEGVDLVKPYAFLFANWKLPSGAQEAVQVVGFDVDSRLGAPWDIAEGSIDDLRGADTVLIDEHYKKKLGVKGIGDTAEINGHRARVVGFTRGVLSFTTAPYVYASFKNSLDYVQLTEKDTIFFAVRVKPGFNRQQVKAAVQANVHGVDVYTNEEMLDKTRSYWVISTGAGVTTLMGAVLGLLVGMVVVAQTIYAATVDHLREYGTLKAMGANNAYLYRVILQQALLSALMGYVLAMGVSWFVVEGSKSGDAVILMPPAMIAAVFVLALVMCAGASILSIRKATRIDPAMVFRA